MFPFTYTFEREIKQGKTIENVTHAVRDSFVERKVDHIKIEENIITGEDNLFKLDFSGRSPLVISPGKEYFIYNESTKTLTYKIEAFYPILMNLMYSGILFLILYNFARHLIIELIVPSLFFILITMVSYFQHHAVIDKISRNLNEN
ncbi:MAG: hypothetical protein MUW56_01655 [Chryseobacterium sp.]|uniref:hypothetical protein n=1 Tax=Chryseobacterium sp. TaxID=1871047 RepID=UPI0025BA846F|nr:hypothetical protein [Chryseobacterium sp.]MCJ7932356.1 hypothetical protein [Chryseobacterium sp.]